MGQFCNQGGRAEPLYELLREQLGERLPAWMAKGESGDLRWESASCLSMCGGGPNAVIYPEDVAFNHLDKSTLEAIINALKAGEDLPK